jgi:hypothetical protein
MLVAEAEQDSRDRSHGSRRDPPRTAGSRLERQRAWGGEAAALVLATQEFVANGGGRPPGRRRQSAASPGRTRSRGAPRSCFYSRSDAAARPAFEPTPALKFGLAAGCRNPTTPASESVLGASLRGLGRRCSFRGIARVRLRAAGQPPGCCFPARERLQAHSSAAGTDAATRPTPPLRCCRRQPALEAKRWAAASELRRISLRVALATWSYGTQDPLVGLRSRDGRRAPSRRFPCRRSSSTASGPPCAVPGLAVGRWSGLPVGAQGRIIERYERHG